MTLEKLAVMVATGFADTVRRADFKELKTDVTQLKTDVAELKTDVSDIKLRLDYLAPKFEVHDLEKRVTRLEIKNGLRPPS